jgi:hypothetical protein
MDDWKRRKGMRTDVSPGTGRTRQHSLLRLAGPGPPNGDFAHNGRIITDRLDVMWGTDATRFYAERRAGSSG